MSAPPNDGASPPLADDHESRVAARRESLDAAAAELTQLRAVQRSAISPDLEVAQRIVRLGFDEDTVKIFDLVPMVHVAWADGEVQGQERAAIEAIMTARGLAQDSPGWIMMEGLLSRPPSAELLAELLEVFRDLVRGDNRRIEVMVDLCVVVAEQHGKLLGLFGDPIDDRERAALGEIATMLGDRAEQWLRAKLGHA